MKKYLLIVDDNPEIIDIVQEVLKVMFDNVMSAATVERAEELLGQYDFSTVILDINLGGRNGAEVIKFLQDHPENRNNACPFVILSSIINNQFIERYSQRFAGIMKKPFDHNELRNVVEKVFSGQKEETLKEESLKEETHSEIPYLKCDLPFPIAHLEQKVNKILDQVRKNTKLKQLFAQLPVDRNEDNFMLSHIGMLVNISTAISIQLEWNTDKTLEKYVYASYLHDVAIYTRPDLARINNLEELKARKDQLSQQDYKLVVEHPNIAAKMIEELSEIPADVAQIVRQHHEMPKEDGFPAGISHVKIVPLSVVFIVAHDMTHYILENPNWSISDYLAKAKLKFKGGHFQKVLLALSDTK